MNYGITDATSGLVYAGESRGLNEAISDKMGVLVDFYSTDRSLYSPNYLLSKTLFFQSGHF